MTPETRIQEHLRFLYGDDTGAPVGRQLLRCLNEFRQRNPRLADRTQPARDRFTERDAILITYGDQIQEPNRRPLQTLAEFLDRQLGGTLSGVHLLPHFPYSSDDGFSVIDYRAVDPSLGTWEDVKQLGKNFRLMFDAVVNHISWRSDWFQRFLQDQSPYNQYFLVAEPGPELANVVRPRTSPLLTPFNTASGEKRVWTTFSDDQIDLNYANPQVLLEMIDVLLLYVERGAELLRLDAIAYLWKQPGTSCIHLPQTHRVVQLFRSVLDAVAPRVALVTETNVPHADNISYFGDGINEAQMVYNFALPPLILHTFRTGNARALSAWAATLRPSSPETTFFNFIASHDGIGVMPARGLIAPDDIRALVDRTVDHGGKVSFKSNPDGAQSPYELNITLYDALNDPRSPDPALDVRRFLASQAIMLSLAGVPGIYVHSLFGSRNWREGMEQTGRARTINRQKFQRDALEAALRDQETIACQVFQGYGALLKVRAAHPSFHPNSRQQVLNLDAGLFGLLRSADQPRKFLLAIVNVTSRSQTVAVELGPLGLGAEIEWHDLVGRRKLRADNGRLAFSAEEYQILWLTPARPTPANSVNNA